MTHSPPCSTSNYQQISPTPSHLVVAAWRTACQNSLKATERVMGLTKEYAGAKLQDLPLQLRNCIL